MYKLANTGAVAVGGGGAGGELQLLETKYTDFVRRQSNNAKMATTIKKVNKTNNNSNSKPTNNNKSDKSDLKTSVVSASVIGRSNSSANDGHNNSRNSSGRSTSSAISNRSYVSATNNRRRRRRRNKHGHHGDGSDDDGDGDGQQPDPDYNSLIKFSQMFSTSNSYALRQKELLRPTKPENNEKRGSFDAYNSGHSSSSSDDEDEEDEVRVGQGKKVGADKAKEKTPTGAGGGTADEALIAPPPPLPLPPDSNQPWLTRDKDRDEQLNSSDDEGRTTGTTSTNNTEASAVSTLADEMNSVILRQELLQNIRALSQSTYFNNENGNNLSDDHRLINDEHDQQEPIRPNANAQNPPLASNISPVSAGGQVAGDEPEELLYFNRKTPSAKSKSKSIDNWIESSNREINNNRGGRAGAEVEEEDDVFSDAREQDNLNGHHVKSAGLLGLGKVPSPLLGTTMATAGIIAASQQQPQQAQLAPDADTETKYVRIRKNIGTGAGNAVVVVDPDAPPPPPKSDVREIISRITTEPDPNARPPFSRCDDDDDGNFGFGYIDDLRTLSKNSNYAHANPHHLGGLLHASPSTKISNLLSSAPHLGNSSHFINSSTRPSSRVMAVHAPPPPPDKPTNNTNTNRPAPFDQQKPKFKKPLKLFKSNPHQQQQQLNNGTTSDTSTDPDDPDPGGGDPDPSAASQTVRYNLSPSPSKLSTPTLARRRRILEFDTKLPGVLRRQNMDQWVAKILWFYINGDEFCRRYEYRFRPGKDVRHFEGLCDILTDRIGVSRGVRYIFSTDGRLIWSMEQLQHEHSYVVSSTKKFKPMNYGRESAIDGLEASYNNHPATAPLFNRENITRELAPLTTRGQMYAGADNNMKLYNNNMNNPLNYTNKASNNKKSILLTNSSRNGINNNSSQYEVERLVNNAINQSSSSAYYAYGGASRRPIERQIILIINGLNPKVHSQVLLNTRVSQEWDELIKDLGMAVKIPKHYNGVLKTANGKSVLSYSQLRSELRTGNQTFYIFPLKRRFKSNTSTTRDKKAVNFQQQQQQQQQQNNSTTMLNNLTKLSISDNGDDKTNRSGATTIIKKNNI